MSRNAERKQARLRHINIIEPHILSATMMLRELHLRGSKKIKIRSDFFVRQNRHGLNSPLPIARISAPRGLNLQLYLLLLFEAQCRRRSGAPGVSKIPLSSSEPNVITWESLVVSEARQNLSAERRITEKQNRERQVRSAFIRLEKERLIERSQQSARSYLVAPLHEGGLQHRDPVPYSVPYSSQASWDGIELDVRFFTEGWIYALTQSEIRLYMILCHLAKRYPREHLLRGIYLPEDVRVRTYEITRDIYESHEVLSALWLIDHIRSPVRHRDGKVVDYAKRISTGDPLPPHRFMVRSDTIGLSAPKRMREALNFLLGHGGDRLEQ